MSRHICTLGDGRPAEIQLFCDEVGRVVRFDVIPGPPGTPLTRAIISVRLGVNAAGEFAESVIQSTKRLSEARREAAPR